MEPFFESNSHLKDANYFRKKIRCGYVRLGFEYAFSLRKKRPNTEFF